VIKCVNCWMAVINSVHECCAYLLIVSSEWLFLDCCEDIKESQNIASLHKQIAACDIILEVSFCSPVCCVWRHTWGIILSHLFAACDVILEVSFCLTCLLRVMSYLRYPSAHLFMCTLHLEVSFCSPVHVYVHCVLVLENVTVSCFN